MSATRPLPYHTSPWCDGSGHQLGYIEARVLPSQRPAATTARTVYSEAFDFPRDHVTVHRPPMSRPLQILETPV